MVYFIYVLFFESDKNFYTGYTENLKLRLGQHKRGEVKSTKKRGKFKLVYFEGCLSKSDALKRERYLKTYLGKLFLRNRLKSYLTG